MAEEREYVDYLRDMLANAEHAQRFVAGVDLAAFLVNEEKVYATIRALEILGEASKKIPRSVRTRHPQIPWRSIAGMRDKLVHDYFGADVERVWRTVREDVPTLVTALTAIIEAESKTT